MEGRDKRKQQVSDCITLCRLVKEAYFPTLIVRNALEGMTNGPSCGVVPFK